MNTRRCFYIPLSVSVASLLLFSTARASTNDREYRMGDDGAESASNGGSVGTTFDSQGQLDMSQLHDLVSSGSPVYRTISGRPDGGSGLGIELNGSSQYLRSARLGEPGTTASALGGDFGGTLNYTGLTNRGFQFWVQPAGTGAQTLVMDTNQHGARINASGNFSMRYADTDFDSTQAVVASTWYHVMVVRPNGANDGARMYVDGVAVATAAGGYDGADTADLVVGANTAGDDGGDGGAGFSGGTEEFFGGIIDDLTMFVVGESTEFAGPPSAAGVDFGEFDFATDNAFAAFTLSGVPGDVDNDGDLDQLDKNDFIAGWMRDNLVNDIRVPDLKSYAAGDLDFDGITDIIDLVLIQAALPLAGLRTIAAAELNGIAATVCLSVGPSRCARRSAVSSLKRVIAQKMLSLDL